MRNSILLKSNSGLKPTRKSGLESGGLKPTRNSGLKSAGNCGLVLASALIGVFASCNPPEVPTDPQTSLCSIPSATIAGWFGGTITLNGAVNPANSITFPGSPNCSFYQWSEQMFLWMTSPTTSIYGGSGRIFDSPAFFDVSPPDANNQRTLIPHTAGLIRNMAIRAAQAGPHHLPVLLNKAGKMIEIEPTPIAPDGKQLILNRAGQPVEIEEIRPGVTGRPVFLDKDRHPIDGAHPLFRTERLSKFTVQRFVIDKHPIFLDAAGDIVDVEEGESDGGVVMTQGKSLIYYIAMVNDVFAYFRTGTADQTISTNHFPITQSDLSPISALAATKNVTFPDSVALAIEVKSAWVLASSVPDPANYITITAAVPHYDTTSTTQWTLVPNVMDTVQLAMVGIHVVGSTAGHSEMIWATFVHEGVAPDSTYAYTNSGNSTTTVSANTGGSWLLCSSGSAGPYNNMRQSFDQSTGNIMATNGNTIGPTDIITMKPWGAGSDQSPNPIDPSSAASNAEIISVNNSVRNALINGDVRKKYIFRGATWTFGGPPTEKFPLGNQLGTSSLANVTMETFQLEQGTNTRAATGLNCFGCHQSSNSQLPVCDTFVSHIFPELKPLF